ncbi:MAG TPA: hypothetical protein VF771_14320 [Longimicrobiaceae bacterium]
MSSDTMLIASAARLVAAARGAVDDYAGANAPVTPDQVRALLAATGCHVEIFPFRSDAAGMTLPLCQGLHPVLVNGAAVGMERCFALRHQVAHVLAGHAHGSVCLPHEGYARPSERLADLFALADAVPGWWISRVVRERCSRGAVQAAIARCVAELVPAWPAERVEDRVMLRLRLLRETGI